MRYANYYQSCIGKKSGKIDPIEARGNEWVPPKKGYTGEISEPAFKTLVSSMTPGRIIVKKKIVEGWFMAVNLFVVRLDERKVARKNGKGQDILHS